MYYNFIICFLKASKDHFEKELREITFNPLFILEQIFKKSDFHLPYTFFLVFKWDFYCNLVNLFKTITDTQGMGLVSFNFLAGN